MKSSNMDANRKVGIPLCCPAWNIVMADKVAIIKSKIVYRVASDNLLQKFQNIRSK